MGRQRKPFAKRPEARLLQHVACFPLASSPPLAASPPTCGSLQAEDLYFFRFDWRCCEFIRIGEADGLESLLALARRRQVGAAGRAPPHLVEGCLHTG